MKRIGLYGDTHSGSKVGLTPNPKNEVQEILLNRYLDSVDKLGPVDILICNGDLVDGTMAKGMAVGDDNWIAGQIDDACELIKLWNAKRVFVNMGTGYHTRGGPTNDFEAQIVNQLCAAGIEASFHTKLELEINDWFKMKARHFVGSSGIPHGRSGPGERVKFWEILENHLHGEDSAHLWVFSHVHYFQFTKNAFGASMTLPSWKADGDLHGDTKCSGHIDLGCVRLDVGETEEEGWTETERLYLARLVDRSVKA